MNAKKDWASENEWKKQIQKKRVKERKSKWKNELIERAKNEKKNRRVGGKKEWCKWINTWMEWKTSMNESEQVWKERANKKETKKHKERKMCMCTWTNEWKRKKNEQTKKNERRK